MTDESEAEDSAVTVRTDPNAARRPPTEHIINVFKAAVATVPYAGGLASLLSDYIPNARARRLEDFAQQTAEELGRLKDRVDQDYLHTDDFAFMFEKCFRAAAENPQAEKLVAFRSILVNSTTRRDLSEEEKEYFLNLAMRLTTLHVRILRFMAEPEAYLSANGIPAEQIRGGFSQFFPTAIPGVSLDVIKSAFGELYREGLLDTDVSIFSTMTSGQGLALLSGRVSNLGGCFVSFISRAA